MPQSRVFIFQGNCLVVPESMNDDEALEGVDREIAERDFGKLDYFTVPPIGLNRAPVDLSMLSFLLKDNTALPPSWRGVMARQLVSLMVGNPPNSQAENFLRCFHVIQWRGESVFCGSCGEKNGDSPVELARLCPRCGRIEYPRIAPAVIVLIVDDNDKILLAHNNKFNNNMYSLIAGFAEAGESLEAAVHREIKEELDIDVKDVRYVKSQSWPFPNSLMIGFTARYAGGEIKPDGDEIADARWFNRETIRKSAEGIFNANNLPGDDGFIPALPGAGSISRYLINEWVSKDLVE